MSEVDMEKELLIAFQGLKVIHRKLLDRYERAYPTDNSGVGGLAIKELSSLIRGKGFKSAEQAVFRMENPDIFKPIKD